MSYTGACSPHDRAALRHGPVVGAVEPNAADFQILSSVRVLLDFDALVHITHGRPSEHAARRLYPRWEGDIPGFQLPRP